jgi:hypothetical protein
MSLASPWGLLALLGIPVVLYFHRHVHGPPRAVPLVTLWEPGAPPTIRGQRRRRFDAILALRLAIVVAVALALARPGWPVAPPQRHVFLLDASASMGAPDGAGSRFEHGLAVAAEVLRDLPPGDEVMLVRTGAAATVVRRFGVDREPVRSALHELGPGEAPKNLAAGFIAARRVIDDGDATVHLFSDVADDAGTIELARRVGLDPERLVLHHVGAPVDNLAIVDLDAALRAQSPLDYHVFARVANFSAGPRDISVVVSSPDGPEQARRLSLQPGETRPVVVDVPSTPWVEVRLRGVHDALPADDRAVLVLPEPTLRTIYVSRGDRFLDAALRAHPRLRIEEVSAARLGAGAALAARADLAVLDGVRPPDDFTLPALIVASRPSGPDTPRAVPVVDWDHAHPILHGIDLRDALVPAGARFPTVRSTALIRSSDGVAARAMEEPSGRRQVELAFPIDRSNLGRMPEFPVLIARIVDWLTTDLRQAPVNVLAGRPVHLALPRPDAVDVTIQGPDGAVFRARTERGHLDLPPMERTGRYRVDAPGFSLPFAVNLANAEESNLRRPRPGPAPSGWRRPAARATFRRELARATLAIGLQLLSFEIWLLQRRRQGGQHAAA